MPDEFIFMNGLSQNLCEPKLTNKTGNTFNLAIILQGLQFHKPSKSIKFGEFKYLKNQLYGTEAMVGNI